MTDSQVLMASRTVDPRRLEFDEEDFIAFCSIHFCAMDGAGRRP
jgi:hypothetical protein